MSVEREDDLEQEYLDRILKWPEQGGLQPEEIAKVFAEMARRLNRLERLASRIKDQH